jgi:MOSC domain-containing protein YiiM
LPIDSAEVTYLGLSTDRHNDVVHHGGPEKAVSLFSVEIITALQTEGNPIYPGSTGENITTVGLDWSLVVAGLRLRLGNDVEIEVTRYASPCSTIRESFMNHDFNRISWRTNPGWARAYARVLRPGSIMTGDLVHLLN